MKPHDAWAIDWRIGMAPSREGEVSRELIRIFASFWESLGLERKGKTTQRRYSNGLHALGGHLVKQAVTEKSGSGSPRRLLMDSLEADDGPLIFHDEEAWQRELDMVCRKLHRHLNASEAL